MNEPAVVRKGNEIDMGRGITVAEIIEELGQLNPELQLKDGGAGNNMGSVFLAFGRLEKGEWCR